MVPAGVTAFSIRAGGMAASPGSSPSTMRAGSRASTSRYPGISTRVAVPTDTRARGSAAETSANPPTLERPAISLVTKRTFIGRSGPSGPGRGSRERRTCPVGVSS